jgi:hypothetical protein
VLDYFAVVVRTRHFIDGRLESLELLDVLFNGRKVVSCGANVVDRALKDLDVVDVLQRAILNFTPGPQGRISP